MVLKSRFHSGTGIEKQCPALLMLLLSTWCTGEVLRGDRIVNTPYVVLMNQEKRCQVVCQQASKLTTEQSKLMAERIQEEYYVHL